MSDPNIRRLNIHRLTYSKCCSKCGYCVKAEWAKNKGAEWGQLVVYCCATGGLYGEKGVPVCPHGISYTVKLGREESEFNPENWGPERFNKAETFTYTEEEKPKKKYISEKLG